MKRPYDDHSRDPHETMPPKPQGPRQNIPPRSPDNEGSGKSRGRQIQFGAPRQSPPAADSEPEAVSISVQRGFRLGADASAAAGSVDKKNGVQPWILVVAGGALVLLVVAVLLSSSSGSKNEAAANERLVQRYALYLEAKGQNSAFINDRRKAAADKLRAVKWAKEIGDRTALESELRGLLFMDSDKNSPLYEYSVAQLKQLPKNSSGL